MNSDSASARPAVLAALRKANAVVGVADSRGWPRPQAYVDALAMLNAAREAERAVPALPPAPDKPKDVKKWVDTVAGIRTLEAARRDVTDELVLTWERETAAAGLAATADYADRLATVFDELVETLDSHAEAPRQLTGHETPDEIEAHTAALRLANDLHTALMERALIADAANEGADVGPDVVWLVLAPHGETTRDGINDALAAFKSRVPQTLQEWDELRPLGLRLAQIGEVATRRERHATFMHTIGMSTPDMGMRDHSYGEIDGNPDGPSYGLARQAETDYMFANSPSMNL